MSDDDLELGGFSPTTPMAPVKKTRTTRPSTRAEPGPSKPKAGRKRAAPLSGNSDIEELSPNDVRVHQDQEEQHPTRPSRTEGHAVNGDGKQATKGKGKAKAAPSKASRKRPPGESVDIGAIEILDEELEDEHDVAEHLAEAINRTNRNQKTNTSTTRFGGSDEISRIRDSLRRAEDQVAALTQQLEEVFQVRQTEAEQLLERQQTQYEAQIHGLLAQELLIKELTSQLAVKEPLTRSSNNPVLTLLTREAADEEKRAIEKEVTRWKAAVTEKQKSIDDNKARIAELEQIEKDLQLDLKVEIERSSSLAKTSKVPGSVARGGRPGGVDDPRHAEILRFYEDVTNLLVPTMKVSKGKYFDMDEWVLSCVYTYTNTSDDTNLHIHKSLNFTLRFCYDEPNSETMEPIISKDQLVPTVNYIPLGLDKEPPDFVAQLGFLGAPFTFSRDQLPLFLRTMNQSMGEATQDEEL